MDIEDYVKLSEAEAIRFGNFIREKRDEIISSPKDTATKAVENHKEEINKLLSEGLVSETIKKLRGFCYDQFLIEEAELNNVVLKEIGIKFSTPKKILDDISKEIYSIKDCNIDNFKLLIADKFGEFSGKISPYIYALCLSNTQSRRSRAGKIFEGIIYFLYEYYNYKYESQSSIGKRAFSSLGLGKVVDSILPSTLAFRSFRNKTIVGSMKTTLRERWQEVVEEISRSNLPNIYLLTVDPDISESKAKQMAEHNIVIVVTSDVKKRASLVNKRNIIDFETYFHKEIPNVMNYWSEND